MKILLQPAYSFSQLGLRSNQQDSRYPNCDTLPAESWAFAVCDGVGGSEKGEVASNAVCYALDRFMNDQDSEQPFILSDFQECLSTAYDELYKAMESTGCKNMSTTLAFLCLSPAGVLAAHVGDSQIYQVRPGSGLVYRSTPHSLVEEMVRTQKITPEEAENYPSNYITRCMGYVQPGQPMTSAEVYTSANIQPGDIFFLCSDGVLDKVPEKNLIEILQLEHVYAKEKLDEIAQRCQTSCDNNTAIIVEVANVLFTPQEIDMMTQNAASQGASNAMPCYSIHEVTPDTPKSKFWRKVSDIFG